MISKLVIPNEMEQLSTVIKLLAQTVSQTLRCEAAGRIIGISNIIRSLQFIAEYDLSVFDE
jgi:hypothetical protein